MTTSKAFSQSPYKKPTKSTGEVSKLHLAMVSLTIEKIIIKGAFIRAFFSSHRLLVLAFSCPNTIRPVLLSRLIKLQRLRREKGLITMPQDISSLPSLSNPRITLHVRSHLPINHQKAGRPKEGHRQKIVAIISQGILIRTRQRCEAATIPTRPRRLHRRSWALGQPVATVT